jgi:hypothetical protein
MTVEDYMKFEKRFGDGCRLSAPQVYISGLLFCPKDSIVWCHYCPMFHNLIQGEGALDIVWPPSESMVIDGHLVSYLLLSRQMANMLPRDPTTILFVCGI